MGRFAPNRSGKHVRDCLGLPNSPERAGWQGHLVTDDYAGYKACFEMGVTEVGCMAHTRRKFHELWVSHQSPVGEQALAIIQQLYEVERDAATLAPPARQALRQARSRPIPDALQQRTKAPNGTATVKAIDYSLTRWEALVRFIDRGDLPIYNNWVENQIRPIALGRKNWLFTGPLRAGQRTAAIMSLIHTPQRA